MVKTNKLILQIIVKKAISLNNINSWVHVYQDQILHHKYTTSKNNIFIPIKEQFSCITTTPMLNGNYLKTTI